MTNADSNVPSPTAADRATIAAVQREILAAMRTGRTLSQAHKEGGTTISWEGDRFVIAEYGSWSSRREFTDESEFLDALWKRYDWMTSPGRGGQRRTELEAWRFILHEVCRTHFATSPVAASTFVHRLRWIRLLAGVAVLVVAAVGFGVVRLLQVRTIGAPFGLSMRVDDSIATLVRTQERYVPSLHRNPDRDRFRIDLLLTPIDEATPSRRIPLARSLDRAAFHPGTKLLGVDGPLLWLFVPELKAVDLRTFRVITLRDLQRANPELDDLWLTARFHFAERLHLLSADRQRAYTIDADTLRARRLDAAPRIAWDNPAAAATVNLCLGGPVGNGGWLVALSSRERDASFRIGSTIAREWPASPSREPRALYQLQVEPAGTRLRILARDALTPESFVGASLVRPGAEAGPQVFPGPEGVLIVHHSGTRLAPGVAATRISRDGAVT